MVPFMPYLTGQRARAVPAGHQRAEVRAHPRHRGGRQDHPARHVLPDERQLLLRRLLQGRRDPARLGAAHQARSPTAASGFDPERIWVDRLPRRRRGARRSGSASSALPDERIQRRGMDDNYWSTGHARPGRPVLEIFYDRGPDYGPEGGPAVDEDRYLEFWNLVFMQYERGRRARQGRLRDPRRAAEEEHRHRHGPGAGGLLLQGVDNLYEIDEVCAGPRPGRRAGRRRATARDHEDDVRLRVVADHVRSGADAHRRRRHAGQRGPRLRAAPAAAPRRPLDAAARRRRGDAARAAAGVPRRDERRYPEVATDFARISASPTPRRRRSARTLRAGTTMFDTAVARGEAGRRRRRCPASRRSSCTTPTASRSTSPSRWPPSRASPSTRRASAR